jgi:hypothetical protein
MSFVLVMKDKRIELWPYVDLFQIWVEIYKTPSDLASSFDTFVGRVECVRFPMRKLTLNLKESY